MLSILWQRSGKSHHIYQGGVFQLVDQALSVILSRIEAEVGVRDESARVNVDLELPKTAVIEAIVNAVCYREYNSSASVQVMFFKGRLEVWNPGRLPIGMTEKDLEHTPTSIPDNPLLALPCI